VIEDSLVPAPFEKNAIVLVSLAPSPAAAAQIQASKSQFLESLSKKLSQIDPQIQMHVY